MNTDILRRKADLLSLILSAAGHPGAVVSIRQDANGAVVIEWEHRRAAPSDLGELARRLLLALGPVALAPTSEGLTVEIEPEPERRTLRFEALPVGRALLEGHPLFERVQTTVDEWADWQDAGGGMNGQ